jgi:hypothetical protein
MRIWTITACIAACAAGAPRTAPAQGAAGESSRESGVHKLVAAAWRDPPARVDLVVYREIARPSKSPEQVRSAVEKAFDLMDGPEGGTSLAQKEEVDANVRSILKSQEYPRYLAERFRTEGTRLRVDLAKLAQAGDFGMDVRLTDTYVSRPDPTKDGYKRFEYMGEFKSAWIHRDSFSYGGVDFGGWIGMPNWAKAFVRAAFGKKSEKGAIVPDETKIKEFLRQGSPSLDISFMAADSAGTVTRDRIEFVPSGGGGRPVISLVCDRNDYWRVYRAETWDPSTGRLTSLREADGFDANGFPQQYRFEAYDEQGKVRQSEIISFLKANINPAFSDDVFEFRPPPGYSVVDARESPPRTLFKGDPSAPEAGETIGEALQDGAAGVLEHIKRGWEARIELPASRPATQPTTRPAGAPAP